MRTSDEERAQRMKCYDVNDGTFVTLSVIRTRTGQIELVRESETGVAVYYDSPEDALRRWNAWTLVVDLHRRDEHGGRGPAALAGSQETKS